MNWLAVLAKRLSLSPCEHHDLKPSVLNESLVEKQLLFPVLIEMWAMTITGSALKCCIKVPTGSGNNCDLKS